MDQQFKSYRTFKNYLWKLDKNVLDFFKKGEFKYKKMKNGQKVKKLTFFRKNGQKNGQIKINGQK